MTKQKEYMFFKGKAEVMASWGGTVFYPKKRRDRFGILKPGEYRTVRVQNKDVSLCLPHKFGNKEIEIIIRIKA